MEEFIANKWDTDLNLILFAGVGKYKSINRAYKRGHVTSLGLLIPKHKNQKKSLGHVRALNDANHYLNLIKKQYGLREQPDNGGLQ
jgi:hypothetical protein